MENPTNPKEEPIGVIPDNEDVTVDKPEEEDELFQLPFEGEDISEESLKQITSRYRTSLILLVGEPESGKSTLYASILDRFYKGRLGKYIFAGTRTPIGFESRAHLARCKSLNLVSKNERTNTKTFSYLHLEMCVQDYDAAHNHILFADVNGERFRDARDTDEDMQSLTVMKRADHIIIIADGELLLDAGKRLPVKKNIIKFIERAKHNDMIDMNKGIHLVVSKWDKINQTKKETEVEGFLIEPLRTMFPQILKSVIRVASRSTNPTFPAGSGLEAFLDLCISNPKQVDFATEYELTGESREFQKFKYSQL